MKQLRDNWMILTALLAVGILTGRTLQRVDRIEQDISSIKARMGLVSADCSTVNRLLDDEAQTEAIDRLKLCFGVDANHNSR